MLSTTRYTERYCIHFIGSFFLFQFNRRFFYAFEHSDNNIDTGCDPTDMSIF
jgi:hypothetical protein